MTNNEGNPFYGRDFTPNHFQKPHVTQKPTDGFSKNTKFQRFGKHHTKQKVDHKNCFNEQQLEKCVHKYYD